MENALKGVLKSFAICAAVGTLVAACGGGDSSTSNNSQSKLLIDTNSVKINVTAANVTASSTDAANVPGNAVDNNLGTHWTGGAASGTQWVQFKLPACYTADYANISWYNGDQRQYNYTIDVSPDNGASWTTVKTGATTGTSAALVLFDFPQTAANMVRVSSTGSNVSTKVSINEVEIWGLAGATCASGNTTTTAGATTTSTTATAATTTTTTAGSGLNPSLPPGGNFNLGNFTLQLPSGSGDSVETLSGSAMEGGSTKKPYFYTDTTDGSMVMMDPKTGVTTANSQHPRTELRENGDWNKSGTNILEATLKVTKIPSSATAIAQVFQGSGAPSKPLCELQYGSGGAIQMFIEDSNQGGVSHMLTGFPTVAIGSTFNYKIKVSGSTVTTTINGTSKSFTMDSSFGSTFYFKAGNYWQGATKASSPATADGAVVKFYALKITH